MNKEEHDKIIDFVNSEDYMLLNSYISKPYEETIVEQDKEIERLNNIIEEIEKWTKENNVNNRDIYGYEMEDTKVIYLEDFLDKLKALKGE